MAHCLFDLRAEGLQENHVPDDVRPAVAALFTNRQPILTRSVLPARTTAVGFCAVAANYCHASAA